VDLHDKLNVEHEWTTPIGSINIYLPEELRQILIVILTKQGIVFTEHTYNKVNNTSEALKKFDDKIYNLFDYDDQKTVLDANEIDALAEFEKISSKIIRTYIHKAWGLDEDAAIKARCFGNVQRPFGRRTAPHFHHAWDGVLVHYLTVGEEFNYPLFSDADDWTMSTNDHLVQITARSAGGRKAIDDKDPEAINSDFSGDLIMLDPRPAIKMPYNNKAKTFKPEVGMTLIHPGYVWHETQTHTKAGIRVAIVINFNIENRNWDILPTYLI
tara:strand:- start:7679 stop:8488 length:810 start_codon:yes stop_codon:yes gene_type:complete